MLLISFFIIGVFPGITRGDQFEIIPYLGVRGEYNDNIFFAENSNDAVDDYILTIIPGVVLTDRTERFNSRFIGQVAPFYYKYNPEFDAVDQDYRGRIEYQFTPRFYGRADAFYGTGYSRHY